MIKLKEVQQTLRTAIHENPRLVWEFSSTRVAQCRTATKALLQEFVNARNAQRPQRGLSTFTGTLVIDVQALSRAASSLQSSLTNLQDFYSTAQKYVHEEEYVVESSDDYDTAVSRAVARDQVAARIWGNGEFGDLLTLLPDTYRVVSANGPFSVPEGVTYTIAGEEIELPPSLSYLRSKAGPFTFINISDPYLLEGTIGGDPFVISIPSGVLTADGLRALLQAADIASYVENDVVTVVDTEEVQFLASPACTTLGFPVGKTRSSAVFTDCDDIATLLGAEVLRNSNAISVIISEGACDLDNGVLVLSSAPYGTYLVKNHEVLPYLSGSVTDYSGPAWFHQEQLQIARTSQFSVTTNSTDPLEIVKPAVSETTRIKDVFSIRPFVGDVLTGWSEGRRATVNITKVQPGAVTVNFPLRELRNWELKGNAQHMCSLVLQALPTVQKLAVMLNTATPQNAAEWESYKQLLSDAEQLYASIRPLLASTTSMGTKNSAAATVLSELSQAKYDLAVDSLVAGDISSFFLLNDITASSAKMLAVFRSSL
jgi:hypothetical protein